MATNINAFNFMQILSIPQAFNLSQLDWTLDELSAFVDFLKVLAEGYKLPCCQCTSIFSSFPPPFVESYNSFQRNKKDYEYYLDVLTDEEIEQSECMADTWQYLRNTAEEMALMMLESDFFNSLHS